MDRKQNILIDLDSILDVRLAILYSLLPKSIASVTKKYVERKTDLFPPVPYNLFKVYYDRRNKNILNYGIPTNILKIVEEAAIADREHITRTMVDNTIFINTYPYKLTENEKKEFSARLLKILPFVEINYIFKNMEELSTKFIVENEIFTVIMYDGLDWLEKQVALLNIVEDPLLGRTLIVPALINTPGIEIKKEMFEKTAKAYEVIIDLIFIDARFFSPERERKNKK